jgi:maltose alpha-D-glucosyltransferase/alpha-amylase
VWYLEANRSEPGRDKGLQQHARFMLYMTLVRTLGQRTAELHQALSRVTGDPAFDPEPVAPEEIKQWWERVRNDVSTTLSALRAGRARLPAAVQPLADLLLTREADLYERVGTPPPLHTRKTRYHGDYHLGQVLVVQNDFVITDFEGEPIRPLAERRAKHSPLRDVAGMSRSFNYATYNALRRVTSERAEDYQVLEPLARAWEAAARERFLEGYRSAAAGSAGWPDDPQHAQALIDLFTLEKALYEMRYDLSNRPEWVEIPLRGVLALLPSSVAATISS